ncbi:RNA cytidine acetyltransferase 1 isoform X3 [Manihot esculenta]|uniref:RNA cytidine acetyltransferase 1 isoform X3 n=1 Tax=Manihot esculenta TaxID=3983 RepID=UPI000B5D4EF8|nr:RNA cytidine acetyltransferase 1 isoform X3 [Manihot esculenta]
MRKKVDERIRTLIENGVKLRHRSMFVIIGDKSRDQIVNLHYMLSKAVVKSRPTVLWCYKDKLELSSHKKKRAKQIKKLMQRGLLDPEKVDPFSLFVETGGLTYCLYKDSERILGNTFGMCILQDFEALTPNLLARTIETVEGGGLIVLLLRSLSSLTSLYTMVMDVHDRFRTESHSEAAGRFNERFLLSLASCKACVVMDDELNVLPISSHIRSITPVPVKEEHIDYDIVKSANPEFKKATVRINIYKQHRQTIQYIQPHEHQKLSQVELLVVDEAAAIPLPVVKSLLGPYLVFLSSTVNGYEGTGRSLSLKLLQQLEDQSHMTAKNVEGSISGRLFKKIELSESIRYASGDPIESWLNALLCLDVANSIPSISRLPPPSECDLYYVNRDTLFSYHKDSELFLQRMMALYVASHYKNSPNDLQLMADAPAHHLFVLLGPVDESKNKLPDILCVIQVSLEGQISRKSAIKSLSDGHQPFGDQIPWKFCEQFRDTVFPSLSGARVVRIATHPSAMRLGYASAAMELLTRYYEGQLTPISEVDFENNEDSPQIRVTEAAEQVSLLEENIKPRTDLPHLLVHLRERRAEKLHYLGVSFGLTLDLFRFWRKHKFAPFYIGQIPSTVTGEHTCMVLKPLNSEEIEVNGSDDWGFFGPFYQDFKLRFARLLESSFRTMEYKLAMSVLDPKINYADTDAGTALSTPEGFWRSLKFDLSPYDMERLKVYTENLADFHLILDIVPILARLYFQGKLPITMSYVQASVLLCIGLQHQNITYMEDQMKLERTQILSLFIKVMKKFHKYLYGIATNEIESTLPRLKERTLEPHSISVEDDLNEAAKQVEDGMKTKMEGMLNPELLQQYAIVDREGDFENALRSGGKITSGGLISVKSSKTKVEKHGKHDGHKSGKKRKGDNSSKSNKKSKS